MSTWRDMHMAEMLPPVRWGPKTPLKQSHLSKRINQEIKRVAGVMTTVCLIGATLSTVWNSRVSATRSGPTTRNI